MTQDFPTLDFIAGLITGEGSFMIISQRKSKVHVFQLRMQASERPLLEAIKERLGISDSIYEYRHQDRHYVMLLIRKRETLIKNIIPAMDERLFGLKKIQFDNWKKSFYSSMLYSKRKKYLINLLGDL